MRYPRPARAVVKIGSSSLRGSDGRLDRGQVRSLAAQLARARAQGTEVVLVSSGAVAAGMGLLGLGDRPADLPTLQACAAAGQGELIHTYQRTFARHGVIAAQILLTQDDFVRRGRYLNGRTAIQRLLVLGAVPVINENDAVGTEELVYGDNDHLAALVASMLDAQLLLLLSDVDGLYDGPPADPRSRRLDVVSRVSDLDLDRIGGPGTMIGSGGMRTKVEAAHIATSSGSHAVIAPARRPDVIARALAGDEIGTWFRRAERRLEARRLWIGFALRPHGRIHVDDGAVRALEQRGTSLLAVGITAVDGDFGDGDAVDIVAPDGRLVARGLTHFDAADVRRLAGRSTADAVAALGSGYGREVVHRDDLVLRDDVPARPR